MKYKIVPIETLTKDQNVIEVCKMLGYGEIPQNAAQAAAWNLANGMSWQELAEKNRVEFRKIGYTEKFFSPQDLALANRIAGEATQRAKDAKPAATSPGEQLLTTGGLPAGGQ
jgi:citrate synthase